MQGFLCPKCGKRAMNKQEIEPGNYQLVCTKCGFHHRMLPNDDAKKGFV